MSEELIGHAVAMVDLPFDHTYVTSSARDRWECKGRSRGGRIICRGSGDVAFARCLACPDGRAGVSYGVTGVCHQIANRILYPASIRVERANGYNRSFRFYGDYGADLGFEPYWPQRGRCEAKLYGLRDTGLAELYEEVAPFVPDGLQEPEAAYVMQSDAFIEQSVQRMALLLDRALGDQLDPGVRTRVEQIVAATAARQRELVLAFENGKIAPTAYLEAFNELVATDFRRIDEVLGRDAFLAVFGEPPDVAAKIIDPQAFAAAHGPGRDD